MERLNGTLRRGLLDHVWPLGLCHLNWLLERYAVYYNHSRPHMGLHGRIPVPPDPVPLRAAQPQKLSGDACVIAIPHLGGLHHDYRLQKAA